MRAFGIALAVFCLLLAIAGVVLAQTGGGYDLSWWTVDGGGGAVGEDSGYTLNGDAGQPDAEDALSGGGYTLAGGFWSGGASAIGYKVYLPLVLRQH